MKKPATWIYKTSEQLRSFINSRVRSLQRTRDSSRLIASGEEIVPADTSENNRRFPPYLGLLLKIGLTLSLLIGLYALLGFYAIPKIVKAQLPSILKEQLGRDGSLAFIEFDPFKFHLLARDFKLAEKSGKPFAEVESLSVQLNARQSIKQFSVVIDDITLKKPTVRIARTKDGAFNFSDLSKPEKDKDKDKKSDSALFPITIVKLALNEGKLLWEDNHFAKPVSEEIFPLNFKASNFTTNANEQAKLDLSLAMKSAGKLGLQSTVGINPFSAEGSLNVDKASLPKLLALAMSDTAPFAVDGFGLVKIDYKAGMDKGATKIAIKNANLTLQDAKWIDHSDAKNQVMLAKVGLDVTGNINVSNDKMDIGVEKAKLSGQNGSYAANLPQAIALKIPALSLEAALKLDQNKDKLAIQAEKSMLSLDKVEFGGLPDEKVKISIPKLELSASTQTTIDSKDMEVIVSKGQFALRQFKVTEKGVSKTLASIPEFGLNGIGVDLKKQELNIDSVSAKNAEIQAWLNKDGSLNYQHLIPPAAPKHKKKVPKSAYATAKSVDYKEESPSKLTNTPTPDKAKKDWLVKIGGVNLNNFGFIFEDKTLKKPVTITAKPINFSVKNFVSKLNSTLPFQLEIGVNKTGSIKLKGNTVITPLSAAIDVNVKNIGLPVFQPYLDKFANLDVLGGKFNLDGKLNVAQTVGKPLDVKFKGNTGISDFLSRDRNLNKDLVKWRNLTFSDVKLDLLANKYSAALLTMDKPYARVTIRKDKTINFSDVVIKDTGTSRRTQAKAAQPTKTSHAPARSSSPSFELAKVKIINGSSDFADLSLILPFAAQILNLNGGADGISSEKQSTIKAELNGNAYDIAPVSIKGEISPYTGKYNVDLKFDGMPMPLVTPYMVEFAGYKIEKGKLTLGLNYQIDQGKLNAANNILIDQLELGEKVDNPKAVSLPLELAVALLKDSDGKIKLDVPLTGSLDDPQFSIGHIIVDALVNVLTKIVTSPFNAIASLIGSEEDLSTIAFAPGKSELSAAEIKKLDDVAKGLTEKPILTLEVKGAAYQEQDWAVLKDLALHDQLKSMKAAQISRDEGKETLAEYVELSEDEYNDLLAEAFIERFPTMAEKSLLGKPKLIPPLEGDFYEVAKEKMSVLIKPDLKRLTELANSRAKEIAKYLVQKRGIPNQRIFINDSVLDPERKDKEINTQLSLKTG